MAWALIDDDGVLFEDSSPAAEELARLEFEQVGGSDFTGDLRLVEIHATRR